MEASISKIPEVHEMSSFPSQLDSLLDTLAQTRAFLESIQEGSGQPPRRRHAPPLLPSLPQAPCFCGLSVSGALAPCKAEKESCLSSAKVGICPPWPRGKASGHRQPDQMGLMVPTLRWRGR